MGADRLDRRVGRRTPLAVWADGTGCRWCWCARLAMRPHRLRPAGGRAAGHHDHLRRGPPRFRRQRRRGRLRARAGVRGRGRRGGGGRRPGRRAGGALRSYGAGCAMGGAALTDAVARLVLYEPGLGIPYPPGSIEECSRRWPRATWRRRRCCAGRDRRGDEGRGRLPCGRASAGRPCSPAPRRCHGSAGPRTAGPTGPACSTGSRPRPSCWPAPRARPCCARRPRPGAGGHPRRPASRSSKGMPISPSAPTRPWSRPGRRPAASAAASGARPGGGTRPG